MAPLGLSPGSAEPASSSSLFIGPEQGDYPQKTGPGRVQSPARSWVHRRMARSLTVTAGGGLGGKTLTTLRTSCVR